MRKNEFIEAEALTSLRIVSLRGANPFPDQLSDYKSAYALWKMVWLETFKELDGVDRIFSDDFSRQDEILCLFRGPICLAVGVMRWRNLDMPSVRDDSYFEMWPTKALEILGSNGKNIVIASNLAVHPMARRNALGLPMKDVMLGLLVKRFLESGADAMTGAMRADRGMHTAAYQLGASVLESNLVLHNSPVELVAFFPQNMISGEGKVGAAVQYLWDFKRQYSNHYMPTQGRIA
jgi:hypothetical protein